MDVTPLTPGQRAGLSGAAFVAAFASLWRLGTSSALPDEVVYVRAARSLMAGTGDPNLEHPPLAKFLYGLGQELTGLDLLGARLVAAVASLAIGVLLFLLVRRIAGNRAGVVAAALWAVLPHAGAASGPVGDAGRLDRFAMLDPISTALALAAVTAGWSWLCRPRWQAAALTGLLGGLAAGAKPTGVLVLPGIALLVLWVHRDRWPRSGAGVALAVLASLAGLALAYLPLGGAALDGFRHLVEVQGARTADGHVVTVAGTTSAFPPWWSHMWFSVRDDGWLLTIGLYAGAMTAPFVVAGDEDDPASLGEQPSGTGDDGSRRGPLDGVALLLTVLATTFAPLALSSVKLPFYRYAWLPYLVALAAITATHGWAWIVRVRRDRGRPPHVLLTLPATLVVGLQLLLVTGASHLWSIATLQPDGYGLVAQQVANSSGFVEQGYEPMLVRGRPALLDFHAQLLTFPGLEVRRTDDLDVAAAVLLDPDITSRFPHPADEVRDDPSWDCAAYDELLLCRRVVAVASPP